MKSQINKLLLLSVILRGLFLLSYYPAQAALLPSDVLAKLNSYNVIWTTPSTTGSAGSMPIGNGDITANVWVESGGDLVMYIGKSDSWSEATRLLKVGETRFHFSPNPFASGQPFNQTLNYYNGEIDITAGQSGSQVTLRIYADANQPVIRVVASGQQNFTMSCSNEIWRSSTMQMNSGDQDSFRGVTSAPTTPSESADQALSLSDRLVWYHQNLNSYFGSIFGAENLSGYSGSYTDPWYNRIFGATVLATNFTVVNNKQLQSGSGNSFLVSIYPYTAQTTSESIWQSQMNSQISQVTSTSEATARNNHYAWWDAFWNRSWIFVSGDANATSVTAGYLAQRWTEACQGRGKYPIKFNGGTFTFDHNGQNGDFRAWGPGYWNQNTRLLYWPMLASGDFDMMKPFFNIYTNMLPLQTAATLHYYGHGGAFFPETFNIFGLYYADDWGWNNSGGTTCGDTYIKYHYSGGLETLAMMLSYYNYTQDSSFATSYIVPFATQAIRFFEDHWPVVNGKFFFYPANACEMYWSCTNSADYISGLMSDINQLQALPSNITTPALLTEWNNVYNELPALPMDPTGTYIKPAQTYGSGMNSENPECYPIFPYRLYGLGLPNFNIALATFNNRTVKTYKYDWSQDPIEEALVGLTSSAQTDVINNFKDTDSTARYQAFWATRNDYLPTEDTGGAAMSALQYMLMQCVGSQIMVIPSWPSTWSVDYKLNAASNTTVRLIFTNGIITTLTVSPSSRSNNIVVGSGGSGVIFYANSNYGGTASQAIQPGNYTLSQLAALGCANDTASSVQIPTGWTVTVYSDDNYSGTSWTLTTSTPNFATLNPSADNVMSSCKIQASSAGVVFYQDTQYGGTAGQSLAVGTYTEAQLAAKGVPNDWASSVQIPSGRTVIMYANDNFAGTSWTLTANTPDFTQLSPSANDQMSSCKVQ
jgi:alpha-L-fucosidase 2